jgi:hypothetical protein
MNKKIKTLTCGHRMSFGHPMSQILINSNFILTKGRGEAISLNEVGIRNYGNF